LAIDGPLFKQQRMLLERLLGNPWRLFDSETLALLSGLQNLCDSLADQAYDHYGIDALLTDPADSLENFIRRHEIPNEQLLSLVAEALTGHNVIQQIPTREQIELLIELLGSNEAINRVRTLLAAAVTEETTVTPATEVSTDDAETTHPATLPGSDDATVA
jgi:hypothetical protein